MTFLRSFILTAVCFFAITSTVYSTPIVRLELSSSNILVGDDFSLGVYVDGVTDVDPFLGPDELLSFGFDFNYNFLEFVYIGTIVELPFLDDSLAFSTTDVAGSVFPGLTGDDILLATMNFTALMAGNFNIGIISDLFDLNEGLSTWLNDGFSVPKIDITSSINVTVSAPPVPEPTTASLFIIGLLGAVGVYRRNK